MRKERSPASEGERERREHQLLSRTYPLQFPSQLNQYLKSLSTAAPPPSPSSSSSTSEKPPSPSANFLIVPIQRLVLFARILKDFDLFAEDDKVNLLKGSAIEIMVFSSNTLFNPKTHTFNNYLSRDQRAMVDEQVMPLDPLLKRLWGEDLFERTRHFLISMCNLQVDEVTSTLLVPVILFSPDRSNIKDLHLVKQLQVKYATLVLKYMHWRYGFEQGNQIYPRLLLQIVNIRTLSLSHSEVIQKVMATSSVNPLVQEIAGKTELPPRPPPVETDFDSEDEETNSKKPRLAVDDELDDSDPKNIWRQRRKFSPALQTEITNIKEEALNEQDPIKADLLATHLSSQPRRRLHDHQVPNFVSTHPEPLPRSVKRKRRTSISLRSFFFRSSSISSVRHLPPKKQSSIAHRDSSSEQYFQSSPSPHGQFSPGPFSVSRSHSIHQRCSSSSSSQCSSLSSHSSNLRRSSTPSELFLVEIAGCRSLLSLSRSVFVVVVVLVIVDLCLSLASNRSETPLAAEEQRLLDAIHAHPNKRDLVLSLLRQMNESTLTSSSASASEHSTH